MERQSESFESPARPSSPTIPLPCHTRPQTTIRYDNQPLPYIGISFINPFPLTQSAPPPLFMERAEIMLLRNPFVLPANMVYHIHDTNKPLHIGECVYEKSELGSGKIISVVAIVGDYVHLNVHFFAGSGDYYANRPTIRRMMVRKTLMELSRWDYVKGWVNGLWMTMGG